MKKSLWWESASYLSIDGQRLREIWEKCEILDWEIDVERTNTVVCSAVETNCGIEELLSKFSSWMNLLRVTAWCLRFKHNVRTSVKINPLLTFSPLLTKALNETHYLILRTVQGQKFKEEVGMLERGMFVKYQSKISFLNLVLDDSGILRGGGRLQNEEITEIAKNLQLSFRSIIK